MSSITSAEKARLTDEAVQLFKVRNRDFYPCQANSDKLVSFVESQLGMSIDEYPYPVLIDSWQAAYDHILRTGWFQARPEEDEIVDEAALREDAAQQKVRADYAARVEADRIARAKTIPIEQLGAEVAQQNNIFREQKKRNQLPTRTLRLESRPLMGSKFPVGQEAQARANVALENPSLPRDGAAFNRLYALELSRLRS